MSIQNLIDELRKALPGYNIEIRLDEANGAIWVTNQKRKTDSTTVYFGDDWALNTPDEALTLLRQRLGLEE